MAAMIVDERTIGEFNAALFLNWQKSGIDPHDIIHVEPGPGQDQVQVCDESFKLRRIRGWFVGWPRPGLMTGACQQPALPGVQKVGMAPGTVRRQRQRVG